jgi:hypothetical protein
MPVDIFIKSLFQSNTSKEYRKNKIKTPINVHREATVDKKTEGANRD